MTDKVFNFDKLPEELGWLKVKEVNSEEFHRKRAFLRDMTNTEIIELFASLMTKHAIKHAIRTATESVGDNREHLGDAVDVFVNHLKGGALFELGAILNHYGIVNQSLYKSMAKVFKEDSKTSS